MDAGESAQNRAGWVDSMGFRSMAFCRRRSCGIDRLARAVGLVMRASRAELFVARTSAELFGRRLAILLSSAFFLFAAATLGGCGVSADGLGALMVDPARYDGYNCKQLSDQWNGLLAREKQLRNLIDKADEGGGGTVIGALAYNGDYQTVLEDKKVLQRAAAARKCQLTPSFASDQTIR
jgi:hypothetical protein